MGPLTKPETPTKAAVSRDAEALAFKDGADISDLVYLDPLTQDEIPTPDKMSGRKTGLPIGVVRDLFEPYRVDASRPLTWSTLPDGTRVWAIALQSAGAVGLRLGLEAIVLPDGASLLVSSISDPEHTAGPYTVKNLPRAGVFWTETIFDDTAVLECRVPPGSDTSAFELTIRDVAHIYTGPDSGRLTKAGSCNRDVSCADSTWQFYGAGVARITYVDSGVAYLCTGALLNNAAKDFSDYFLTANHCIGNQAVANTLECYWFYKTSSCNGAIPSLSRVPRTGGGAIYLSGRTDSVNDYTFLVLRQAAPGGSTYLGWNNVMPGNGASVRSIHHPDGTHKRISYGNINSQNANWLYVRWSSGVTEGGSSGGPLMNSSGQVIGQLWGGLSSCANLSGIDDYGRFNVAYPDIRKWLNAVERPANDDFADAITIKGTSGYVYGLNQNATKQSGEPNHAGNAGGKSLWWKWTAPRSAQTTIATSPSDFDTLLAIYTGGSVNSLALKISNDDLGGETSMVTFNAVAGITYRIAVDGYQGASGFPAFWWNQSINAADHISGNPVGDYGVPGSTDLAAFNPATGSWYVRHRFGLNVTWNNPWGWAGARPVVGDFNGGGANGTGAFDLCVYDPAGGYWYMKQIVQNVIIAWKYQWGWNTAKTVSGDFNGDGKWDMALFDTAGGYWYIRSVDGQILTWKDQWGWSTAKPVSGDYNGDGKWDQGIFDTIRGAWYVKSLGGNAFVWNNQWGWSTAKPVPGDYDGDGVFDVAVFDTATGDWFIKTLTGRIIAWRSQWGWAGAKPVSGDFDGDGIYDLAVVDGSGNWYIRRIDGSSLAWKLSCGFPGALYPSIAD